MKGFDLKRIPIFSKINPQQLKKVEKIVRPRTYRRGENIFTQDEVGENICIIISGLVKIFTSSLDGKMKTLTFLKKDDFFGEIALLDKSNLRSATVDALQNTKILTIRREDFENLLKKNPTIALRMLETLSARLRVADKQIADLTFQTISGRVAVALLELAGKYGEKTSKGIKIALELTHQEIADLVGAAREQISRVLTRLKWDNCIKIEKPYVFITNKERLREWIY